MGNGNGASLSDGDLTSEKASKKRKTDSAPDHTKNKTKCTKSSFHVNDLVKVVTVRPSTSKLGLTLELRGSMGAEIVRVAESCPFGSSVGVGDRIVSIDGKVIVDTVEHQNISAV